MIYIQKNKKKISQIILIITIFSMILMGCQLFDKPGGIQTHTPTASATPTCVSAELSTPDISAKESRLFVILYDPRSTADGSLTFANKEKTQDIPLFIRKVIPNIMKSGDQVAIFQLGYSTIKAARVTRLTSYTTIPLDYHTPAPADTLTPLPISPTPDPKVTPTQGSGFQPIVDANNATKAADLRELVLTTTARAYDCIKVQWNTEVASTANVWNVTATAEISEISLNLEKEFKTFSDNADKIEVPFRTDELYHGGLYNGLDFVTTIFQNECKTYTQCTLIIFDDFETWGKDNPDELSINLAQINRTKVNILSILPNCKDIVDCIETTTYWTKEFNKFGVKTDDLKFWNGDRAEINLVKAITGR